MKPIVLITGGSGYIGQEVIRTLRDDYEVINLDKKSQATGGPDYFHCDFSDNTSIERVLREVKVRHGARLDSVIHLAAYYDFQGLETDLYQKVNVEGTQNFLEELHKNFEVSQIIYSSSMLVYRPSKIGIKLNEESPLEKTWAYPNSKISAEEILQSHQREEQLTILRIAAVYNEFGYAPSIGNQIMRIAGKQLANYFLPGDRHHVQSAVHVSDVAEVIKKCIQNREELPRKVIFNVAEDQSPSYDQIQQTVSRLLFNRKTPYLWIPKWLAVLGSYVLNFLSKSEENFIRPWMIRYADANYDMSNTQAREFLDWKPRYSLLKVLPLMIRNLKHNPDHWNRINNFHKRVMHEV